MSIIIETDLGRDPDDFFAICYLASAGIDIKAIVISPGDKDQIAVGKFLVKELGLNIPVGSANPLREKSSLSSFHIDILSSYKFPFIASPDGKGSEIIHDVIKSDSTCELFVCGPLTSVGEYLKNGGRVSHAVMQGGFIGYNVHGHPVEELEKFIDKTTVPTFNLNGDINGAKEFISDKVQSRCFVGKNVCHTLVYDKEIHKIIMSEKPRNRASELFRDSMDIYLDKHQEKKFHDPSAAVCMTHPEIGIWFKGEVYREKGDWGTRETISGEGDNVLVDINREALWNHIAKGD